MRIIAPLATLLLLLVTVASHGASPRTAPSWELNDLQGQSHRLEEWRGKWVLLKLGRTDCDNCTAQWGEFAKMAGDFRKHGVTLLDIYVREERYAVQKHVAKKNFPIQPVVLYDWKGDLVAAYKFSFFPHLVLVDPEGRIAWEGGFTPAADLSQVLTSNAVASADKKP